MMAARLNKRQTEQSKAAIRTTQLVKRLQNHANGNIEMTQTQVQACKILLQKTLPDLKSTALTDSEGNSFSAQFIISNG